MIEIDFNFSADKCLQGESIVDHLQVPGAMDEKRSPHRQSVISQDITDTVANFVDFVKESRKTHHRYRHNMHTRYRGNFERKKNQMNSNFISFFFCMIGSWSTSSSPVRSPSPSSQKRESNAGRYGTTSLQQRSRSPSPSKTRDNHFRGTHILTSEVTRNAFFI